MNRFRFKKLALLVPKNVPNFKVKLPSAFIWALIYAAAIIVAMCSIFDPFWTSNDDVVMSMIAHGYGVASQSSPNLLFSNVLWGYLVSSLPSINGVVGYSWMTLTMLLFVAWSMLYFLNRLEVSPILVILVVPLIVMRVICAPQFTILAGLLAVSAVIGWIAYFRTSSRAILLVATLLGFAGYLIRSDEFWFVMLVSLPLFPWKTLVKDRYFLVCIATLAICMSGAGLADRYAYSSPTWQEFKKFDRIRVLLTDFGVGDALLKDSERLQRFGYSKNDLNLLVNWFYVDTTLTDTEKLDEMLEEVGLLDTLQGNYQSGLAWKAIYSLTDMALLPFGIVILGLFMLVPRRGAVFIAIAIFLGVLIALGLLGRPGVLRVYYPPLAMLAVAPLLFGSTLQRGSLSLKMAAGLLFLSCALVVVNVFPENQKKSAYNKRVKADMLSLQAHKDKFPYYVAWAYFFPYEFGYSLLSPPSDLRLYALSAFTNAPFSVAFNEGEHGRDLPSLLRSGRPIPVIASKFQYKILSVWCRERFHQELKVKPVRNLGTFNMYLVSCETT